MQTAFFTVLVQSVAGAHLVVAAGKTPAEATADALHRLKMSTGEQASCACFEGIVLPVSTCGQPWRDVQKYVTPAAQLLDRKEAEGLMQCDWSLIQSDSWVADVAGESSRHLSVWFEDSRWWLQDSSTQGCDEFLMLFHAVLAGNDVIQAALAPSDGYVIVFKEDGAYNGREGSGFPVRLLQEAAVYPTEEAAQEAGQTLDAHDIVAICELGNVLSPA